MRSRRFFPLVLMLLAALAYHNCFQGVFVYDDRLAILKNPTIRQLWPPTIPLTPPPATPVAARPVVNLSLAVNYAISGVEPWSYHLVNLLLHALNGWLLFGIIRRSGGDDWLAFAATALWVTHPLQTEAVMYTTQRTELLFAFFLLLTVHSALADRPGLAVAACALGMGSKETMVVAPVLVWWHDRLFSRKWRPGLYLALAGCWLIVAAWHLDRPRAGSVGFAHLSPVHYALTQCAVISHYLRLVIWPRPLVIDYEDWPVAQSLVTVWPQALVLAALLLATGWALRYRPRAGYLGAWFFLILAPTSSILPIATELAAERRMYLPLAAVTVGAVCGLGRLRSWRWLVFILIALGVGLTVHRNQEYHSEVAILESAVAARPNNARVRTNLGNAYLRQGDPARARPQFAAAVQARPQRAEAHNNLGVAVAALGDSAQALAHYRDAVVRNPRLVDAQANLGLALVEQGRFAEAIPHLTTALRLQPDLPAVCAALDRARAAVTPDSPAP